MADYYELSAPVERESQGQTKTYWINRVGVMFPAKNGDGFTILLDAVPTSAASGQIKIIAKPPRPRDDRDGGGHGQNRSGSYQRRGGGYNDDGPPPITEDDVPF